MAKAKTTILELPEVKKKEIVWQQLLIVGLNSVKKKIN